MARHAAAVDFATRIEQLLEERRRHEQAIAQIDQTLEQVNSALLPRAPRGRPGRKPGWSPLGNHTGAAAIAAASSPSAEPSERKGRRRRRGRYAISGDDSILNFVRENKSPTTQEIKRHWMGEGRGGTADNVLSKLVKAKMLKRQPLEGERGSRYFVA